MKRFKLSMLALLLSIPSCATVHSALVEQVCPRLPALDKLPADALERSYTDLMQNFLRGSDAMPTNSDFSLKPAMSNTTRPAQSLKP